jgi:hypothetical protein
MCKTLPARKVYITYTNMNVMTSEGGQRCTNHIKGPYNTTECWCHCYHYNMLQRRTVCHMAYYTFITNTLSDGFRRWRTLSNLHLQRLSSLMVEGCSPTIDHGCDVSEILVFEITMTDTPLPARCMLFIMSKTYHRCIHEIHCIGNV